MGRSLIHMLNVFAERMEIDHGPVASVAALRLFAKDKTLRRAEHRDGAGSQTNLETDRAIEAQRTLFAMLPSSDATDRLKAAMMQRAYDLLWDGDALGCDALLEFIPSADAEKLLNAWSSDFEGDGERSVWHKGTSP